MSARCGVPSAGGDDNRRGARTHACRAGTLAGTCERLASVHTSVDAARTSACATSLKRYLRRNLNQSREILLLDRLHAEASIRDAQIGGLVDGRIEQIERLGA